METISLFIGIVAAFLVSYAICWIGLEVAAQRRHRAQMKSIMDQIESLHKKVGSNKP